MAENKQELWRRPRGVEEEASRGYNRDGQDGRSSRRRLHYRNGVLIRRWIGYGFRGVGRRHAKKERRSRERREKRREERERSGSGLKFDQNKVSAGNSRKMKDVKDLTKNLVADMATNFGVKSDAYSSAPPCPPPSRVDPKRRTHPAHQRRRRRRRCRAEEEEEI